MWLWEPSPPRICHQALKLAVLAKHNDPLFWVAQRWPVYNSWRVNTTPCVSWRPPPIASIMREEASVTLITWYSYRTPFIFELLHNRSSSPWFSICGLCTTLQVKMWLCTWVRRAENKQDTRPCGTQVDAAIVGAKFAWVYNVMMELWASISLGDHSSQGRYRGQPYVVFTPDMEYVHARGGLAHRSL